MSKLPAPTFQPEPVTFAKAATAVKEAGAEATKALHMLDPQEIGVFCDSAGRSLNPRVEDKGWQNRVAEIAEDIKVRGFLPEHPLSVFSVMEEIEGKKVPVIYVKDGHTRLAAVNKANAEGADVKAVPVVFVQDGTTLAQIMADMIRDNSGTPWTPMETALHIARVREVGGTEDKPMENDAIAGLIGKTPRYVSDLLVLASAPKSIQNAVQNGEIAASVAFREIRKHGPEKAAEIIAKAIQAAKNAGKAKATPSTLAGKKKATGKKKAAPAASESEGESESEGDTTEPGAALAPGAPDNLKFARSAMQYAVDFGRAAEGIRWLKAFIAEDKAAVGELEKWMGQPEGSFFDVSLRVADDDLADL